jgi:hypothetical protein
MAQEDKLGLEEIVHLANKIGMEYADAKSLFDRLDTMKNTVRARISLRIDPDGIMTEARLKRLTDLDPENVQYLTELLDAKRNVEKLKIRYDSYCNLFDAKRSLLSYQKAEMKLL